MGSPRPPGFPKRNCLLSSSFSTSASQALTAPRDLSEPQPPHPQGGIKDCTATSGGRTTEPGMAWAVTTGCQALQTPGQNTEAEKCPNAEAHSWYLWMSGVFLFVDCWCNFCCFADYHLLIPGMHSHKHSRISNHVPCCLPAHSSKPQNILPTCSPPGSWTGRGPFPPPALGEHAPISGKGVSSG